MRQQDPEDPWRPDDFELLHAATEYCVKRLERNPVDVLPANIIDHIAQCEECRLVLAHSVNTSIPASIIPESMELSPVLPISPLREGSQGEIAGSGLESAKKEGSRGKPTPIARETFLSWRSRPIPVAIVVGLATVAVLIVVAIVTRSPSKSSLVALAYDAPADQQANIRLMNDQTRDENSTLGSGGPKPGGTPTPLEPIATYTTSMPLFRWDERKFPAWRGHVELPDETAEQDLVKSAEGWTVSAPLSPGEYVWYLDSSAGGKSPLTYFWVLDSNRESAFRRAFAEAGADPAARGSAYQLYGMVQQARQELAKAKGDVAAARLLATLPAPPSLR